MMRNALFHRSHKMKTFDVSVNVLNNNVLSDKLLWKERTTVGNIRASDRPPEIVSIQLESQAPGCNWRPPELRLEMILLLLPFTYVVSFIIVFLFGTDKPMISTVVGCALVLSTPAVLMIVHQKRTCVKIDMYVHILLLHAAGLLTILHQKALPSVFVVFVLVFAHLGWQVRRADSSKDSKGKTMALYFLIAAVNAVTLGILLRTNTQSEHSMLLGVDPLCVVVGLLSLAVYVAHNYI